jgi:hypothetical protein
MEWSYHNPVSDFGAFKAARDTRMMQQQLKQDICGSGAMIMEYLATLEEILIGTCMPGMDDWDYIEEQSTGKKVNYVSAGGRNANLAHCCLFWRLCVLLSSCLLSKMPQLASRTIRPKPNLARNKQSTSSGMQSPPEALHT